MDVKMVSVGSLQPGRYVVLEGAACKIMDMQVSRPGKHGHAKVRLTAVGIIDDKKREVVMPGHDNIEVPVIDKRNAQILSMKGDIANVMDTETYETFDLAVPEEIKGEVTEGSIVVYWVILDQRVMKQVKTE